jgi:hypothetical protein
MTINTREAAQGPSPLWIIALFIALSEVMAGVAAIATDGTSRLIFACFSVAFPLLVLAVFTWLLLKHPANLYSPGQFTLQTSIEVFARTLAQRDQDRESVLKSALVAGIAEATHTPNSELVMDDSLRERVAETVERKVDEASLTVDVGSLTNGADQIQIPVTSRTRVDSLLNTVYFAIAPAVRPFKYGESWVLATEDMRPLPDMGTKWANRRGLEFDSRSLDAVGIHPGNRLVVVVPKAEDSTSGGRSSDSGEPKE